MNTLDRLEKFSRTKSASIIFPVVATVLLFVLWELIVRLLNIPNYNLPAPSAILQSAIARSSALWENSMQTLFTTLAGFLLAIVAGIILGFVIGYSRLAYIVLYPLLVGFNTIPKVALVPLFALWFGIGTIPAILTAFLLAFFPIAVNVALGLDTVEPEMKDVMRSLGASQFEIFQKIGFPHVMPYIFASLKVAISLAFVGAVISETVASNKGIGYLIVTASSNFDVPLGFAGLMVLAIMGTALYGFFAAAEKYLIYWAR
ncbi:ABC transporter permease [Thermoleptolyngbya sp. C42_A2020_037]|uniref:ABC transporter permease n=1 Tax=Thermoleptolyngbya sp. C42_A2020_037 TaxID=2747799 RepID=UPI0019F40EB1|nr:ABC transporter permease [Thermoleptolyngbya sp. C42_A2020_037]MBF2084882.1 ABC transporter permease [Thermoleptolyngbya sp. C42_A2020_037]